MAGRAGFRLLRRHFRQYLRRVHGRRPAGRGSAATSAAARTCATISRSSSRTPFDGRQVELQVDTTAPCEPCAGSGAKAGTSAQHLRDVRRPRPGPRAPGLLRGRADLPDLPRRRRDDRRSLPDLPRRGPGREAQVALGQHPRRRRRGHPHPPRRRRRGGRARRPGRRSLHLRPPRPAPDLPARGHDPVRALPGQLHHRGAGRLRSRCPASTSRSTRSASRPASSPASSSASAAPACRR